MVHNVEHKRILRNCINIPSEVMELVREKQKVRLDGRDSTIQEIETITTLEKSITNQTRNI